MIHDARFANQIAATRLGPGGALAFAAATALCDTGAETAELSRKLVGRTRMSLASYALDANSETVGRAILAAWDASRADFEEHAERVSRIWRRYLRDAAEFTVALTAWPLG